MEQKQKKRSVTGKSSTDLILSSYTRNNEEIFPLILKRKDFDKDSPL